MARRDWKEVGRSYWEGQQAKIDEAIQSMEWHPFPPTETLPAGQGMAVMEMIRQFKLKAVKRIGWSHHLAPCGLVAVENRFKNGTAHIYMLDRGNELVSLCVDFEEAQSVASN